MDKEKLLKQLGRVREQERERDSVLMKEEETIRKFCIDNGYNYEVISRAVKLHQILPTSSLEEVMNRAIIDYNHHGQKQPSTGYQMYDVGLETNEGRRLEKKDYNMPEEDIVKILLPCIQQKKVK